MLTPDQARAILQAVASVQDSEPYQTGYVLIEIRKGRLRRIYPAPGYPLPPDPQENTKEEE